MPDIHQREIEIDRAIERLRILVEDTRLDPEDRRTLAARVIDGVFEIGEIDDLFTGETFFSLFDQEFGKDRKGETNESIRHKRQSRRLKRFKEVFGYA